MEKPSKVRPATPTEVGVCTIGHSNRPLDVFLDLLAINDIGCVVDVRTVPRSRHNPQFGNDTLPHSLAAAGINYRYMEALGGLRHAAKDSPNTGWRNASFRGYADHMQSPEFARGHGRIELAGATAALRADVRRSRAVALPPLDDRRCPAGARHGRRTHHRAERAQEAYPDAVRPCRWRPHHLPGATRRRTG